MVFQFDTMLKKKKKTSEEYLFVSVVFLNYEKIGKSEIVHSSRIKNFDPKKHKSNMKYRYFENGEEFMISVDCWGGKRYLKILFFG